MGFFDPGPNPKLILGCLLLAPASALLKWGGKIIIINFDPTGKSLKMYLIPPPPPQSRQPSPGRAHVNLPPQPVETMSDGYDPLIVSSDPL